MERAVAILRRALFSAAVVGGLTFGAFQALAGGAPAQCHPPYVGTCVSDDDCQQLCDQIYPPPGSTTGECTAWGCCACWI